MFNELGDQTFLYALYRDDNIRMWSTRTGQCVASIHCVQGGSSGGGNESRPQGRKLNNFKVFKKNIYISFCTAQTNSLRRASPTQMCAFLCYSMGSEFVRIHTHWDGANTFTLSKSSLIQAPQNDLVDFELNDTSIWALWCNAAGEFNVSTYSWVVSGAVGAGGSWVTAALEPLSEGVSMEPGTDPKDTYCTHIFYPGRFQRSVIAKALVVSAHENIIK